MFTAPSCFAVALLFALASSTRAQSSASTSGYVGYNLTLEGDQNAVVFSTDDTRPNVTNETDPDVYLNATVHVTEIDLQVDNLTAKVQHRSRKHLFCGSFFIDS